MATLPTTSPPERNIPETQSNLVGRNIWSHLRDFLSSNHQPHEFTSDAFKARDLGVADPFPILQILPPKFPRLLALLRFFIAIFTIVILTPVLLDPTTWVEFFFFAMFVLLLAKLLKYQLVLGNGSVRWVWSKIVMLTVSILPSPFTKSFLCVVGEGTWRST